MNKYDERRCSACIHSHRIDDITYECDAVKFDIDTKTCFVPKEAESDPPTRHETTNT